MASKLLSIEVVAERLGVSKRQVRRYEQAGFFTFLRLSSRSPRVRESDLETYIANCQEEAEVGRHGRRIYK